MTSGSAPEVRLRDLAAALDRGWLIEANAPDAAVTAITHDSRHAGPGTLFVALRGTRHDGHAFVCDAFGSGAVAAVVELGFDAKHLPPDATLLVVPDTRRAFSRLAAEFYGRPSEALDVVGITGTNGKTTTAHLVQAILDVAGKPCGRIGTLGAHFKGAMWPLENTTPLALELQAVLGEMRARGAAVVVMEVSSHALALDRVADVAFAWGVLTNVTRDHLDFHGTFDAYASAKRRLFDLAERAAICVDDDLGRRWAAELRAKHGHARVTTFGLTDGADVVARDVTLAPSGSTFAVDGLIFSLRLGGRFNVTNALGALAVARGMGVADATSAQALAAIPNVPGRMEHVGDGGIDVFVDYAHTPDALGKVLAAARETTRGRVIAVFGCGGDRDRGKRPEMGALAAQLADVIVVTSDNPRSEDPLAIVREIVAGMPQPERAHVEVNRRRAIEEAVRLAAPGDVIVVAGKGHETYQIVGAQTLHFDDRDAVRAALAARTRHVHA